MARGSLLMFLLLFLLVDVAVQDGVTSTQTYRLSSLWQNETCEDICGCLENIMRGLNTPQICLEVKGYPCHLARQLLRAPLPRANCSVTIRGRWFECDQETTDCTDDNVENETNCNGGNSSHRSATNKAYLGCESTVSGNTSTTSSTTTCVLSRDRSVVGQCVSNAECIYKKVNKTKTIVIERVSCPYNWSPLRRYCVSPTNGILEPNILDQRTWNGSQNYCKRRWQANLISLPSFSPNSIYELQKRNILVDDQEVWLGLFRDSDNSSFRWSDDTPIVDESNWPWAEGHPKPSLNYVYMLNQTLYSAESKESHRYSCKKRVVKTLKCRQPGPTEIPLTTELSFASSPWTRKPQEPLAAFHEKLTEVRDDVTEYLKKVTNNTSVLDVVDNLISYSEASESSSDEAIVSKSTTIVQSLDSMMDGLSESIVGPAQPLVVSTPEIVLKVVTLCADCEESESLGGQLGNQTFSIALPDSIKAAGATLSLSTASLLHQELPATIDDDGGDNDEIKAGGKAKNKIGSLVSTISLRRWDGEKIQLTQDEPLQLTFSNLEAFPDYTPSCRYWKASDGSQNGAWSSEGCRVATSNKTHTVCHITHLTSFAVIMQISRVQDPLPKSLEYLSWVGCALSIACLAIMLVIFLTQKMYRADRNIIHMNLALSLMLAQIIFVFGIDRTEDNYYPKELCRAMGICVHFFLLATFFWMLNEGIFLLSKTTSAKTRWLRLPTYFTLGWVFPLIIVGVTMAVSLDLYDTKERCWLTIDNGGIWAFVGPAAAVITINVCILVNVIRVFLSLKANMNKKKIERIRMSLRAILLTLPLLGCTWLVGMLSFNSDTQIFAFIFVILNSLQGVFIFILYCVLNDEIQKGLRKRLALLQTLSGRTTHTRGSRTATPSGGSNNQIKTNIKTTTPEQDATKL